MVEPTEDGGAAYLALAPARRAPARAASWSAPAPDADHAEDADDARVLVHYTLRAGLSGLVLTSISIALLPGWMGATIASGQGLLWSARMLQRRRSRFLRNILVFGMAAGLVELLADAWLVEGTKTLVYAPEGPFLAASPAYMPVAWCGMLCAGITLAAALRGRCSLGIATAAVTLALGLYIPSYEAFAAHAGWWHYQGCPLLFGIVPFYIVIGEVLTAVPIALVTDRLRRASTSAAAALGAGVGLWILASYALAHGAVTWCAALR